MSLASTEAGIGSGRVLLARSDRKASLIDRQPQLTDQAEQPGLLATTLKRGLDGAGNGGDALGPDRACRALQAVGCIGPRHAGVLVRDRGQQPPALLLEQLEQLALERPVAEGLSREVNEIESLSRGTRACHLASAIPHHPGARALRPVKMAV